ncbi:hypothetical protein V6N11_029018 [Hibiscus sabdariffa]|uniref:Uncharacterized protein n=1 Tax=Hibiscus sabdariffa TaxID=183260 RepID=A0ABR2NW92_9ROSI
MPNHSNSFREVERVMDLDVVHSLENCCVGTAKSLYDLEGLFFLTFDDIFNVELRVVAGTKFLIIFVDEEPRYDLECSNWSKLSEWFAKIELWTTFSLSIERITWLEVHGVKFHNRVFEGTRVIAFCYSNKDFGALDSDFGYGGGEFSSVGVTKECEVPQVGDVGKQVVGTTLEVDGCATKCVVGGEIVVALCEGETNIFKLECTC